MWAWFRKIFFPSVECQCGGQIKGCLTYGEAHYKCHRCGKDLSEEDFYALYRIQNYKGKKE